MAWTEETEAPACRPIINKYGVIPPIDIVDLVFSGAAVTFRAGSSRLTLKLFKLSKLTCWCGRGLGGWPDPFTDEWELGPPGEGPDTFGMILH